MMMLYYLVVSLIAINFQSAVFTHTFSSSSGPVRTQHESAAVEPVDSFLDSLPRRVRNAVLWYADHETADLTQWEDYGTNHEYSGGGIFITGKKSSEVSLNSTFVHSGNYSVAATIRKAIKAKRGAKAIRLMRWTDKPWDQDGDYFPDRAYYSVWLNVPHLYNPNKYEPWDPGDGGWWNVYQFKSDNEAGSQPIVELDLYFDETKQTMQFGLSTKHYPDPFSDQHVQTYRRQKNPLPVIPNKWTHVEVFLKKSRTSGAIKVWQDGTLIFKARGIVTQLGETTVWGIGNYTDHIDGGSKTGTATLYFDDAIVSKIRISKFIGN